MKNKNTKYILKKKKNSGCESVRWRQNGQWRDDTGEVS